MKGSTIHTSLDSFETGLILPWSRALWQGAAVVVVVVPQPCTVTFTNMPPMQWDVYLPSVFLRPWIQGQEKTRVSVSLPAATIVRKVGVVYSLMMALLGPNIRRGYS